MLDGDGDGGKMSGREEDERGCEGSPMVLRTGLVEKVTFGRELSSYLGEGDPGKQNNMGWSKRGRGESNSEP